MLKGLVYPLLILGLFSCKEKSKEPKPDNQSLLSCKDALSQKTHRLILLGEFTKNARTIVPKGENYFPIELNEKDVKILNRDKSSILCRVLARRGIGVGEQPSLPAIRIRLGQGLRLAISKTAEKESLSFHIPPAESSELLVNYEHSLDRLLDEIVPRN